MNRRRSGPDPGSKAKPSLHYYFIPAKSLRKLQDAISGDSEGCFLEFNDNNEFARAIPETPVRGEKVLQQVLKENSALRAICKKYPQIDGYQACVIASLTEIQDDYHQEYSRFVNSLREEYPQLFGDRAVIWRVIQSLRTEHIIELQVQGPGEAEWMALDEWAPEILVEFENRQMWSDFAYTIAAAARKESSKNANQ